MFTPKSRARLVFIHLFHFAFVDLQSSHHFFNRVVQDVLNLQGHQADLRKAYDQGTLPSTRVSDSALSLAKGRNRKAPPSRRKRKHLFTHFKTWGETNPTSSSRRVICSPGTRAAAHCYSVWTAARKQLHALLHTAMSLSTPCLPNSFQSRTHLLPAVYHHNWFLPLTASAPALSEMTVRDVLETQSLQLLERSCENFVPIQNKKKERLVISILGLLFGRDTWEKSGPWDLLNHRLIRLQGVFIHFV